MDELVFAERWVHPFTDEKIVFTGGLQAMTRTAAAKIVRDYGGIVSGSVTADTGIVVIGQQKRGISTKERRARQLIAQGVKIRVMDEEEFLWLIQLQKL